MDMVTSGDASGLLAPCVTIYDGTVGGVPARVDILLEHGKGGDDIQHMLMPSLTKGTKTPIAEHILEHAKRWKIATNYDEKKGAFTFDSHYLRLNLAGMAERKDDLAVLEAAVGDCPWVGKCVAKEDRKELIAAMRSRAKTQHGGKQWAPVAIGTLAEMEQARAAWSEKCFSNGRHFEVNVVPAPMLRATFGRGSRPGIMPWSYSSMEEEFSNTFASVYVALREANKHAKLPHLDAGEKLRLNTHSMRAGADAEAMAQASRSGATEDDINLVFRWKLAELSQEMRLRYRGNPGALLKLRVNEFF